VGVVNVHQPEKREKKKGESFLILRHGGRERKSRALPNFLRPKKRGLDRGDSREEGEITIPQSACRKREKENHSSNLFKSGQIGKKKEKKALWSGCPRKESGGNLLFLLKK